MSENGRIRRSAGRDRTYRGARRLGWLFSALVALSLLCFVFLVWLTPLRIVDESMSPTLTSGEIVLCDRLSRFVSMPERGDIVLFQTADGVFLKRIVGMPGETVELVDGRVYINSIPLDESAYLAEYFGDMEPTEVPAGAVFVLGDSREQMYDSRLESVGCIPFYRILGILRFRISPTEAFAYFS